MSELHKELIKGAFTLFAVCIGAFITLQIYFRQKDHELVKQRYLDGGVDFVAAQVETYLGILNHNFARSLHICKALKLTDENFDLKELDHGFLELDSSRLAQIANRRICTLIGSDAVRDVFLHFMALSVAVNASFTQEVPMFIRLSLTTTRITKSHEDVADAMMELLEKNHRSTNRYEALIHELHLLGTMLESDRLKMSAVRDFHKRNAVKKLVERLETTFSEELSVLSA